MSIINYGDEPILQVNNLTVDFMRDGEYRQVVHGVNFSLFRGKTLGIVGESGSGKSVTSMSVMRLLKTPPARIRGSIIYNEYPDSSQKPVPTDLLGLSESQMLHYRGKHIAMIFQEPMTSLNPVQKCGQQVVEMLMAHESVSSKEAKRRTIELFQEVMLPRPESIFDSYPHEISGGQKQRVMIAMALICHPDILIADEPTTALDVTVQKAIVELLKQLQQKYGIAIIFISHDLGVIGQIADDVAVMYKGEIVEQGTAKDILYHPQHPYTQGLLACRPPLDSRPRRLKTLADFVDNGAAHDFSKQQVGTEKVSRQEPSEDKKEVLLSVRQLVVSYALKKNFFGKPIQTLNAVDGVSFDIFKNETLGLVGESGCGKSTLGRSILRLIESHSGQVSYQGVALNQLSARKMKQLRPKLQIVFQDPYSSLNPRLTVGEAILEPLRLYGKTLEGNPLTDRKAMRQRVMDLLEQVGLSADHYGRYPHEFSGGQRQRICIARALIMNPELVICDESVSALDVSVQAQVLNLLNDLKERYGYTYLFITHDLSVVKFISDRIMVMQKGRIIEMGTADDIYRSPQMEYTKKLLDAIPRI